MGAAALDADAATPVVELASRTGVWLTRAGMLSFVACCCTKVPGHCMHADLLHTASCSKLTGLAVVKSPLWYCLSAVDALLGGLHAADDNPKQATCAVRQVVNSFQGDSSDSRIKESVNATASATAGARRQVDRITRPHHSLFISDSITGRASDLYGTVDHRLSL